MANTTQRWEAMDLTPFETFGFVYLIVLDSCILLGSMLVLLLICFIQKFRNATGMLMSNLMIADILIGLCIPIIIHSLATPGQSNRTKLPPDVCYASGFALVIATAASNWALALVSAERYLAVVWPFEHERWSQKARLAPPILWAFVLAHNSIMLLYGDSFIYIKDMYMCGPNPSRHPLYIIMLATFDVLLPIAIIGFAYIRIYAEVKRHARDIAATMAVTQRAIRGIMYEESATPDSMATATARANGTTTATSNHDTTHSSAYREWRAALVILVLVGLYDITWLSFGAGVLARSLVGPGSLPSGFAAALLWAALTNAAVNPWLYTFLNRSYRLEIMKLTGVCKHPVIRRDISVDSYV